MGSDIAEIVRWWSVLFLVGAVAFPLTKRFFSSWFDQGYFFSKSVGFLVVTYGVFLLGALHIAPFTVPTIIFVLASVFALGAGLYAIRIQKRASSQNKDAGFFVSWSSLKDTTKMSWWLLALEEFVFFTALFFWSWIKAHEPDIRGLEKFMDFGFMKSILETKYFPAPDMWYAGLPINYYYFGHTVVAMLTKLSGQDLAITFNLTLATLFALTLTMSFSIAFELMRKGIQERDALRSTKTHHVSFYAAVAGVISAYIVTLGGNLQTIYAFTRGYNGEKAPPPFWTIGWSLKELGKLGEGLQSYWYPNATRFIPYTIHEFPSYSFVVSDIHGHVLSLPFVLLVLALLVVMNRLEVGKRTMFTVFYGMLVAVLLMTNALDGPIYFGLLAVILGVSAIRKHISWKLVLSELGIVGLVAAITASPFLYHFRSFVSGIAINCPPAFLANSKVGPLLFEGVEKCQKSPLWMFLVLWGFFLFCGIWFVGLVTKSDKKKSFVEWVKKLNVNMKITQIDTLLLVLFFVSFGLIIFPEFFYFKDIYPMHFRSNTMFKLGYQAFIMFSLVSGYTIVTMLSGLSRSYGQVKTKVRVIFMVLLLPLLFLVVIYPLFSVRSYFNSLREYKGLYGLGWLLRERPDDYAALQWLNTQQYRAAYTIVGNKADRGLELIDHPYMFEMPVIVEADGDSYTDYERISAFSGHPTVVGWAVHEWLWRGSYDVVSPRREDVRLIYESTSSQITQDLLKKYHVTYIVVGSFEREKFKQLNEAKLARLGKKVFQQGETVIYMVSPQ